MSIEESERESPHIIDVRGNATAEHNVSRVAGTDEEVRKGTVELSVCVQLECACGNPIRVATIQKTVICQECRTEWSLE